MLKMSNKENDQLNKILIEYGNERAKIEALTIADQFKQVYNTTGTLILEEREQRKKDGLPTHDFMAGARLVLKQFDEHIEAIENQ